MSGSGFRQYLPSLLSTEQQPVDDARSISDQQCLAQSKQLYRTETHQPHAGIGCT